MKQFAIFTPTHHDRYIVEAYESLKRQSYKDWNWVLVPNGESKVPAVIRDDPNVKVLQWPEQMKQMFGVNIGALKGYACTHILNEKLGEVLVELDHDDYLTDDCLEKIHKARLKNPKAGFIYSDCVGFNERGDSTEFSEVWGWQKYEKKINGKSWTAMKSFPMTARSLFEIYYCPNHVRCWTAEAYAKAGGFSPHLKVIDDHDLLCRTYLAGAECVHIPDALYMYRRHHDATSVHDNELIQRQQTEVGGKYLHPLIKEWCRREKLQMFDLGGAHNPAEGFTTVDLHDADVLADVTRKKWCDDNQAGAVRCADFLEHIPIPKIVPFVNRLYQQMAPGAWWLTSTPSSDGRGAFCDPTHVSFWNELSFRYYTDKNYAKYVPKMKARFQQVNLATVYPSAWHKDNNVPYVMSHMCALKGQRQPGMCVI